MGNFIFQALLEVCIACAVWGEVKQWRFDTNWDNGTNWNGGRVPGCDDAALVPGTTSMAVALPRRACVRSLMLGEAVELLLPRDGALWVAQHDSGASTTALTFARGEREFLDPDAWVIAAAGSSLVGAEVSEAVPHVERVPCRWDVVQLPTGSFSARLGRLPLQVQGVRFGQQNLSPSAWRRLRDSPGGQAMLPRDPDTNGLEIGWTGCSEVAGCSCHASPALYNAVTEGVCATNPRCGPTPCLQPVKPNGHCCHVCGAVLRLRVGRRFLMTKLQTRLRRLASPTSGLLAFASRLPDGHVQVVVLESGPFAGRSSEVALLLEADLLADSSLGVLSVSAALPGDPLNENGVYFILLGTLFANCIIFFFIFLVFSNWQRIRSYSSHEDNSFSFARFENVDADNESIEVAIGSSAFSDSLEIEEPKEEPTEEPKEEPKKDPLNEESGNTK